MTQSKTKSHLGYICSIHGNDGKILDLLHFKELEHVLIEKADQHFRNIL